MKHFWHATAEQPPSSSRTSRVQGSNTGITAIACIKVGSLCAWSLGDSLWSHGMRMVETTYISLITYNYGLHIIMNNDILYDQLIMFTTGILWLLIIPPLLVHAIIWYMYILIYIWWGSWNWTVPFPFPMEVSHPTLAFATASRAVLTAAMTCDLLMEPPKNKTYSLYSL